MQDWGILQVRERMTIIKRLHKWVDASHIAVSFKHSMFHSLWVVMNVNAVDWFGQRVLTGYVVITTV